MNFVDQNEDLTGLSVDEDEGDICYNRNQIIIIILFTIFISFPLLAAIYLSQKGFFTCLEVKIK